MRLACCPACVAGAAAVLASAAWTSEPLLLLLQSVLDVGEALASFGNCHFPEHRWVQSHPGGVKLVWLSAVHT
jgi:hypothetical protein